MSSQQLDHHALMRRIEMLDQDECHAAVGRECVEESLEGLEAASGSADPNDWEVRRPAQSCAPRQHAAARVGGGRSCVDATTPTSSGHLFLISCHCSSHEVAGANDISAGTWSPATL
jgi:hypothetical protein